MSHRFIRFACAAAVVATTVALSPSASAQVTSATFRESLDLPDFGTGGPRVLLNSDVALPSAGPQLTGANEISNPANWSDCLNVSFDAATNILSVTGDEGNVYQLINVTLDSLTFAVPGQQITGITPISVDNAVTQNTGVLSRQVFFTPNSFSVDYSVPLGSQNLFSINPRTDTYQVSLSAVAVPEANTFALALPALGMVGAVLVRRRKK
jgi:hypothetical protein